MVEVSLQLSQAFVSQYSDMFVLKLGIVVMSLDQWVFLKHSMQAAL